MPDFEYRVPGANYHDQVYLTAVPGDLLELRLIQADEDVTVPLSEYGVRELRLALQRYERGQRRDGPTER